MAHAVRRETSINQQTRAAVLEIVALLPHPRDSLVSRAEALDLIANILRVAPREDRLGTLRIELARQHYRNLPLVASIARARSGDLRAIDNAPLGAGFRAARALFVTRS